MKKRTISFRATEALKKKIEDLAARDGRSVSGQVSFILERFFKPPSTRRGEAYVYPAASLEAAQEKAKELTEQLLRDTEGKPRQEVIATAETFGVPVSENYRKAFSELRREANERRKQILLQELEKITLEEAQNADG